MSDEEMCNSTHEMIDGGSPCIYLKGHASVGIPHVTKNGLYWF